MCAPASVCLSVCLSITLRPSHVHSGSTFLTRILRIVVVLLSSALSCVCQCLLEPKFAPRSNYSNIYIYMCVFMTRAQRPPSPASAMPYARLATNLARRGPVLRGHCSRRARDVVALWSSEGMRVWLSPCRRKQFPPQHRGRSRRGKSAEAMAARPRLYSSYYARLSVAAEDGVRTVRRAAPRAGGLGAPPSLLVEPEREPHPEQAAWAQLPFSPRRETLPVSTRKACGIARPINLGSPRPSCATRWWLCR